MEWPRFVAYHRCGPGEARARFAANGWRSKGPRCPGRRGHGRQYSDGRRIVLSVK